MYKVYINTTTVVLQLPSGQRLYTYINKTL